MAQRSQIGSLTLVNFGSGNGLVPSIPKPMLIYCQFHTIKKGKYIWKCFLQNGNHFVQATMISHNTWDISGFPFNCSLWFSMSDVYSIVQGSPIEPILVLTGLLADYVVLCDICMLCQFSSTDLYETVPQSCPGGCRTVWGYETFWLDCHCLCDWLV